MVARKLRGRGRRRAALAALGVLAASATGIAIVAGRASDPAARVGAAMARWLPAEPLPPPPPTTIGMNLPEIRWYSTNIPFANLVTGVEWFDARWGPLPDVHQDADGGIVSLPDGEEARRILPVPPTGPEGVEVRCTFAGSGTLTLAGPGRVLAAAPGSLRVRVVNRRGTPDPSWLVLDRVDPRRPFRDLDCREAGLARTARFRPRFLDTVRGYGVLRFMDWQNANLNAPVTWAERHRPGDTRLDRAGVAIEDMLALARETGVAPWFVMPWNADGDYVARFAALVRAWLPADARVYVEVGNEVWNRGFDVGRQAAREGLERGLADDAQTAGLRRYAQRTGEVMRVWERAFAGRDGLVRVVSTQQVQPETAHVVLRFGDTAAHVDALSTSAYFGRTYPGAGHRREEVLAMVAADIPAMLADLVASRRIARSYGKRFVAYEGGEGLVLPDQPALIAQLQRDPAQYALYRRYLAGWRREVGDVLCLLTSVARTGTAGAWGLAEWEDQTLAETPKLRAVREVVPPQPRGGRSIAFGR